MPRLVSVAKIPGNTSIGAAARTGLALLASPAGASASSADVAAIARNLQALMRVQGRTAYVASAPGSPSPADDEAQALALAFLSQSGPKSGATSTLVQKLSAGVARSRQAGLGPLCVSVGGSGGGTAAAALAGYDESRGSIQPDAKITVAAMSAAAAKANPISMQEANAAGDGTSKVLLSAEFTPKTDARVENSSTPWGRLPANATRLSVAASGRGEISVAAGLTFTPATLLPFPTYRGLWVERVVQSEAGEGSLVAASAGEVVTITVQISSADALGEVNVEVMMPGGLEPIDPAVYKDASAALACSLGSGRWWWWCPSVQVAPSVVKVSYGYFGAGTYSVSFKATAATPGTFALPPVKAYAVGQPELMGLSAAGSFVVCPARPVVAGSIPLVSDPAFGADDDAADAAKFASGAVGQDVSVFGPVPTVCTAAAGAASAPPVAAAKSCLRDCSGNGVCNLAAGACVCNQGFAGADCSKLMVE